MKREKGVVQEVEKLKKHELNLLLFLRSEKEGLRVPKDDNGVKIVSQEGFGKKRMSWT